MPDETPHYSFQPLERRGVLVGLQASQLATVGAGVVVGLLVRSVIPGPAGVAAAALAMVGAGIAGLWMRDGSPLSAWGLRALAWLARRAKGPQVSDAPLQGTRPTPLTGSRPAPARRCGTAPAGIELVELPAKPGEIPLGVIHDRRSGTCAAVLPVRGIPLGLLDPARQVQVIEGWRRVLGSLGRPGTPVVRVQWVHRSQAAAPGLLAGDQDRAAAAGTALDSYRSVVQRVEEAVRLHDVWLTVAVGAGRGSAPTTALERELRLLTAQLRDAELGPGAPLGRAELADLLARPHRPERARRHGSQGERSAWALATDEGWGAVRAEGRWHVTFWVSEWPRIDVGPDFLAPLLIGSGTRTVAMVMAPVPPDRAVREVRSARTADLADAELRTRAGFLSSARRERESEGATRREAELAAGYSEFRFSAYVTVSAADREGLVTACADAEHAAQSARIELRRLYGRQAEAFTWTLPLGRGLR